MSAVSETFENSTTVEARSALDVSDFNMSDVVVSSSCDFVDERDACDEADPDILKEYHDYPSKDGCTRIKSVFWVNREVKAGKRPRAIIQIVHGMGEHVGRYDRFARYLATLDFIVCGNDHIGHGATALSPADFGELPAKRPVDFMVEDVHQLRLLIQKEIGAHFPGPVPVPYVMFGHSMGSLILRCYLPKHGSGLAGAIICGTTMPNKALSGAGVILSKALIAWKGPRVKSDFLHRMAYGVYSKKIPNARTKFDWISSDPDEVDAFIEDEATGFMFSGAVYLALTEGAYDSARAQAFKRIPKDLPILLISGDEDPVGDDGKQVEKVVEKMRHAGVKSVTLKLYGGMRHEILNEIGKEEVYSDIVSWIDEVLIEHEQRNQ